jgi:hypothetical protein
MRKPGIFQINVDKSRILRYIFIETIKNRCNPETEKVRKIWENRQLTSLIWM